ncbi:endo alpha-1,4 polygalactosaminidase [Streptomyces lonarensis]|uniref:Endo alpha-1,4 polygalactosaminidase n=1 Tax=Streptomyces lonarensis TaxID=700599 RepID=A0A7X6D3G9_9ACTN|nr:endo alpha-1,4 polygalactosaminidase [Streptomyces lonarensis]NJQ07479.1 endo alpha-1,4 polygalactosaminidase [Streptomyces lonarensis]
MSEHRKSRRTPALAVTAAIAVTAAGAGLALLPRGEASAAEPQLPPRATGWDYQIGGAYEPDADVEVVVRDHTAAPADDLYSICYVNAFQSQPNAEDDWDDDLLLRDAAGEVVYDGAWGEAVLDIRTDEKRERIADVVGAWMADCAEKGFQAVEPDNYDTFYRFDEYISEDDAVAMAAELTGRGHELGLAVAQKNAVELVDRRDEAGFDFVVAENCGQWNECEGYASAYDDRVLVVEYTDGGFDTTCSGWGDRLSVVKRDLMVLPVGRDGYVRENCPATAGD